MTMSKEMMYEINYKTIDTVKQRDLLEVTRLISRFLTDEEFNEIMMFYKIVLDRVKSEVEF